MLLGDRFLLVTQNIDNLHERAGNTNVIHMHGELLKVRCSQSGKIIDWTGDVTPEDRMPLLPVPGPLAPTRTIWFGEMPLGMDRSYGVVDGRYFHCHWYFRACLSGGWVCSREAEPVARTPWS
ncbi:Sir2 family NAD-dependent protein deacetylase [Escherichia coli]